MNAALIAPCGMNCRLCAAFIRDRNPCPGCRGDDSAKPKTRVFCRIKTCETIRKGQAEYCFGCAEFPCDALRHLDKRYRTRYGMSMIDNLVHIKKLGIRQFMINEQERWTCPGCGQLLCVHKPQCLVCGYQRRQHYSAETVDGSAEVRPARRKRTARMRDEPDRHLSEDAAHHQDLPAGDFSSWLRRTRNALWKDSGTEVACGECRACCNSSQFVQVRPEETRTLDRIRKDLLVAAPGLPKGNVLLGYDRKGHCPMLVKDACAIYEDRPLTCRTYDCRVFTAAGITEVGDKTRITQQIRRWKFSYPAARDRKEHDAVKAAAKFVREHAGCFPGGKVPDSPSQLAVLAIKVYDVFLKESGGTVKTRGASADVETARAIVEASRTFDAKRLAYGRRPAGTVRKPAKKIRQHGRCG